MQEWSDEYYDVIMAPAKCLLLFPPQLESGFLGEGMWLSGAGDSKINRAEITVGKYQVLVTISELQNINFISKTNFNNLPPSITHSDQIGNFGSISCQERDPSQDLTCHYLLARCWQSAGGGAWAEGLRGWAEGDRDKSVGGANNVRINLII